MFDRFRRQTEREATGYDVVEVDSELATALTSPGDRQAVSVRPHRDNGGIEAMTDVLESLHSTETESPRLRRTRENTSPAHTFELRYTQPADGGERVASLRYIAGSDTLDGTLERQLKTQYPDSQLERTDSRLLPESVGVDGQYLAGARLGLRRYTLYPIKNIDLPGFTTDPMGSILEEMVGATGDAGPDADVVVQIQFKPALREWTQGVDDGHGRVDDEDSAVQGSPGIQSLAKNLRQPSYEKEWRVFTRETVEYPPSKVDKNVAELLEDQQGTKGWRLCLRVLAVSPDEGEAIARASQTAGMFRNFYENSAEQTFIPEPCDASDVDELAREAASREFVDRGIVKSQREAAGLVNVPEAEYVATNKLRWSMSTPGEGIPPGTPRFPFDEYGVADASRQAQQVAMVDDSTPGDPYWYGFGSRHGVEAGVRADILDTHQFVGGSTGQGKTTFLVNLASQIMRRGHGGLIFDPKGRDVDEFIREWPEDRPEEDFVFVDLSDEYDRQVRFNFLEVPSDADPDSRAFASTVEALCDDLTAMISQAGGQDNYWGALMNRVARTLIRGMAKSGRTCTLLDLAAAVTSAENREQFAAWMSEERLHFIEDAAERIREKEDSDLEPLAGRLDQWIQNDAIRDLIAARESTVSIRDAVREGRVVVVRNAPSSGETEKRLFATALIRRAWVAARESADVDRPPFHVIADEFDSIVSQESNIHSILSEARAFDFPLTLSCQNPSNQLPEEVAAAVENQCETFISFNPGGRDDARLIAGQHSPDVESDDLRNLSKYTFYMRTHDDSDELTHSYKVDAFPPITDVRESVTGESGMSDEELDAFKQRSVERYGTEPESAEEQKAASHFYTAAVDDSESEDAGVVDADDEVVRQAVAKAVYDEGLYTDGDAWVSGGEIHERLERYLDVDLDYVSQVAALVDRVGDDDVERREQDDGVYLRTTDQGRRQFLRTGDNATAGGLRHRELLSDAYDPLAVLGFEVAVPRQSSEREVDAVARLRETYDPTVDEDVSMRAVERARRRFESEHPVLARLSDGADVTLEAEGETARSNPAQVCKNLAKALEQGQRCLFLVREDDASRVRGVLSDPPAARKTVHTDANTDAVRLYNDGDYQVDDRIPIRPDPEDANTRWLWHRDRGRVELQDETGATYARVDNPTRLFDDPDVYPDTVDTLDAVPDEWTRVTEPFVPAVAYPDGEPDPETWDVIAVPRGLDDIEWRKAGDGDAKPRGSRAKTRLELVRGDDRVPLAALDDHNDADDPGGGRDDEGELWDSLSAEEKLRRLNDDS